MTVYRSTRLLIIVSSLWLILSTNHSLFSQEPRLFLTLSELKSRNHLADREGWAKEQRDSILKEAAAFPQSYERKYGVTGAALTPEGGQWLHYYACPDTGTLLTFHPGVGSVCPDNGKVFNGYPYDQVVYMLRADGLAKASTTLALAYRLSGNEKYAQEAANILKAYADVYLTYSIHDNSNKQSSRGARVYSQTLDESIWLIQIAWTYDLLQGSPTFTASDKKHIEADLLQASAATVGRATGPTDNIQSWINAALAAVGYTLSDTRLISKAIDGPQGFRFQMHSYVSDGFWIEGAWHYQFYALLALTQTAQMATHAGTNLWKEEPNLSALLKSPVGVMFADGTLPPFNDSVVENLYAQSFLYEGAYAATRDPLFAAVIEHHGRETREAFLFGAETIPSQGLLKLSSEVYPDAGYATLRGDASDLTGVMKFGPHGGPHGHFDKLSDVIYANGKMLSVDPGTQYYGLPLHNEWDKMTVAHNTIAVDEGQQAAATGKLLSWQATPEFTAVIADAGPAYSGIDLRRTMLSTSEYVLEITDAEASDGKQHVFDWNYHNNGTQTPAIFGVPYDAIAKTTTAKTSGYQHLLHVRRSATDGDIRSTYKAQTSQGLALWILSNGQTEVFTGDAPGPDLKVPVPFLIARRTGTSAEYTTLLVPFSGSPKITGFEQPQPGLVVVHGKGWTDEIHLGEKIRYERKTTRVQNALKPYNDNNSKSNGQGR
jgi:hypothetical protein